MNIIKISDVIEVLDALRRDADLGMSLVYKDCIDLIREQSDELDSARTELVDVERDRDNATGTIQSIVNKLNDLGYYAD